MKTDRKFNFLFVAASKSRARRRIHFQHVAEEDPGAEEREGNARASLRARGGMSHQRFVAKARSAASREMQIGTDS